MLGMLFTRYTMASGLPAPDELSAAATRQVESPAMAHDGIELFWCRTTVRLPCSLSGHFRKALTVAEWPGRRSLPRATVGCKYVQLRSR